MNLNDEELSIISMKEETMTKKELSLTIAMQSLICIMTALGIQW